MAPDDLEPASIAAAASSAPVINELAEGQDKASCKRRMSAPSGNPKENKCSKLNMHDSNSTSVLQVRTCENYELPRCASCQSLGQSKPVDECRFAYFCCLGDDNLPCGFLRTPECMKGIEFHYDTWCPPRTERSDVVIRASKASRAINFTSDLLMLLGYSCQGSHASD